MSRTRRDRASGPWCIGWFGNLRCPESLRILTELADALPDRVRILMRGCDSLLEVGQLSRTTQNRGNMEFGGEYVAPDDLAEIYSEVDFNWCVDLSDGENSRWLIPNRVYEGGFFGTPAIAIEDHQTGRLVKERGLGITVTSPIAERLRSYFAKLTWDEYRTIRRGVEQLDPSDFIEDRDIVALIRERL